MVPLLRSRGRPSNGVAVQFATALAGLVALGLALIFQGAHQGNGGTTAVAAVPEEPEPGSVPGSPRAVGGTIAFTHHDPATGLSGVYVTEGSEPRLVVGDKELVYLDIAWVQGGRRLVYTAGSTGSEASLWIAAPDGGEPTRLADGSAGSVSEVVVAPDGVRVAFMRTHENGTSTVSVMDIERGGEQVLQASRDAVVTPWFACDGLTPARARPRDWSADGEELLISYSASGCEVEFNASSIIAVNSGLARAVEASDASDGSFGPGDGQAAYEAKGEIIVANPNGLSRSLGQGEDPDFSRNDDVVFVAARSWGDVSTYGIWIAPGDGRRAPQPVVEPKLRVTQPKWSPTGSHLAFLTHDEAGVELWAASVGGRRAGQLLGPVGGVVLDFAYAPEGGPS